MDRGWEGGVVGATAMRGGQTFRGWLREQRKRRDPIGDLARDMVADGECWTGRSGSSLDTHIQEVHNADNGALNALARARHEWLDQL